jgi:hypothetical protein
LRYFQFQSLISFLSPGENSEEELFQKSESHIPVVFGLKRLNSSLIVCLIGEG